MIAVIATLRIAQGMETAIEEVISRLGQSVRAHEPAVMLYQACRSRSERGLYRMMELYEDDAALGAHERTTWFAREAPKFRAMLAGDPVVEILDAL